MQPLTDSQQKSIFETPIETLAGKASSLAGYKGKTILLVNVASKCGLTPQYEGLEALQKKYEAKGFAVLGFPCNQFGKQEPGSSEEIQSFCSTTYGVTFPMFEKIEVNGNERNPIYQALTQVKDSGGEAGDIQWNFEKFLISKDGKSVRRFRPKTEPLSAEVVSAIEANLES